jgi:hypothetical protein
MPDDPIVAVAKVSEKGLVQIPLNIREKLDLSPGRCIILTFTGTITFGHTQLTLVPSTAARQVYYLSVVASNNAQANLSCTLPLTSTSCTSVNVKDGW